MPNFNELFLIIGYERLTYIGNWCAFGGSFLYLISFPFSLLSEKNNEAGNNLNKKFSFIIWPAIVAQTFFNALWGEVGKGFGGVLTWRSFYMTLIFSLVINIFCVVMILNNVSKDTPEFNLRLINILFKSELWFITCNFLGDLLSINVTRFLLNKIIEKKVGSLKYIAYDLAGILGGYIITMIIPSFFVLFLGDLLFDSPNEMIQAGLFGNLLVPFFLSIFAVSFFPSLLSFFALFSILSITIPTGIYLFFIITVNLGYRIYKQFLLDKKLVFLKFSRNIRTIGGIFASLGTVLTTSIYFLTQ